MGNLKMLPTLVALRISGTNESRFIVVRRFAGKGTVTITLCRAI